MSAEKEVLGMDVVILEFMKRNPPRMRSVNRKVWVGDETKVQVGGWKISLQSVVAFSGTDGKIHVGLLDAGDARGESIEVWCGDVTYTLDFPCMVVFHYAGDVPQEVGRLVGMEFDSWVAFALRSGELGAPVDMSDAGNEG